jgi:two-component system OmpR family sensor kinase
MDIETAQHRIEQLEAELAHAQQCLRILSSASSHDLREPLHVIRLFAQVLRAQPQAAEHAGHIADAATRMGAMLQGVFRVASLRPPNPGATSDLAEAFRSAVQELEFEVHDRSASVVCLGTATVPMAREHLELALVELIGNGVHHHGGRAPSIEVSASNLDDGIVVTVADRGPGLAPDAAPRLPGLFRCGDPSSTRAGVGLTLVQRILDGYGGEVRIRERPAGGTLVELVVPVVRERSPVAR